MSPLFFVSVFIPPPPSLHPSPNRVSYPLCLHISLSLPPLFLFALAHPSPFSCTLFLLLLISPVHCAWGNSSKSNCLSISHQYAASRGSCPLKTMRVGLSAEPWMGFNYINEQFSIKTKRYSTHGYFAGLLHCTNN